MAKNSNLRTISVSLVARTEKFSKGMKKASRDTARFGKRVNRVSSSIGMLRKLAGPLATSFSFAGIIAGAGKVTASLDKVAKTSAKLNFPADKLLAFHHAAKRAGVATTTFDMAIQRMARRIGEAAKGTGEALGAIKELGLNAQDLANMSTDKMFLRVAGAVNQAATETDKLRLMFKLFDSEGVALKNLTDIGVRGMENMIKRADALGVSLRGIDVGVFERIKNATTDMSAQFGAEFAKQIALVSKALSGSGEVHGSLGDNLSAIFRGMQGMRDEAQARLAGFINKVRIQGTSINLSDEQRRKLESSRKFTQERVGKIKAQTIADQLAIFQTGSLSHRFQTSMAGPSQVDNTKELQEIKGILQKMQFEGVKTEIRMGR
ncbi:MAG: hypothetical protein KJO36_03580 [Acidimicrobiia bacterium]|nr:hypothetical protein [Acidimicrobiia bacterium]